MKISYITVSSCPERAETLRQSIADVGGRLPWVFTAIDAGEEGICAGYNRGARERPADIYCFVHDDVELLGNRRLLTPILALLCQPDSGCLGIAGTRLLAAHGCWSNPNECCLGMVGYHYPQTAEEPIGFQWSFWATHTKPDSYQAMRCLQAVVLDGALLFVRRDVFDRLAGFDEDSFPGYHFYDVDISVRAHLAGFRNYVIPFPVSHGVACRCYCMEGWQIAREVFVRKFEGKLPICL